ncbi:hypothetical protein [Methanosarcina sp. 2.H.T.1A.15]|nr:hypothetical protein [Methanosarcina sp. 2.H.T.1A.15]
MCGVTPCKCHTKAKVNLTEKCMNFTNFMHHKIASDFVRATIHTIN